MSRRPKSSRRVPFVRPPRGRISGLLRSFVMESSRLPTRPARHSLRRVRFHTCPEVDHIFARAPCVSTFCRVWHRWFPELWGFFVPTLEQTLQSKQRLQSVTDLSTAIFVASSVCQKLFDGSQVAVSHCEEGSSRSDQLVRGPITSRGSRDWDRDVLHCCVVLGFTWMCGTTIHLPVHNKDPPIDLAVPCRSVSRFCVVLDRSRTHVPAWLDTVRIWTTSGSSN